MHDNRERSDTFFNDSSTEGGNSSSDNRSFSTQATRRRFFNKRRRTCPFSGKGSLVIDYKDERLLMRFLSEKGKIAPSRITSVSTKKQRSLALAIKRARFLAIIPYIKD